ncbi:MAG: hypothetical protein KAW14_11935 [Candidatus Aegiribacteria sp.]|nr:hypothetical protein [Candidatus Aegiribacteria sp.]
MISGKGGTPLSMLIEDSYGSVYEIGNKWLATCLRVGTLSALGYTK